MYRILLLHKSQNYSNINIKNKQFDYSAVLKLLNRFNPKQIDFHYTAVSNESMVAEGVKFLSNNYTKRKFSFF